MMRRLKECLSTPGAACWAVALLCISMTILLWSAIAIQINLAEGRIISAKRAENHNLTQLLAEHTRRTFRNAENVISDVEARYRRQGRQLDLVAYWRQRGQIHDSANVVAIVDGRGDRVLTSIPNARPQNYAKSNLFLYHLHNPSGGLHISQPRLGRASGKWTFYLSRRLIRPGGGFDGVVVYGLNPAYFTQLFQRIDLGANAVVNLIGRDGIVRARSKSANITAGQNLLRAPLFTTLLPRAATGSTVATSPVDGIARIYNYRALGDYPMVVTLGISRALALAPLAGRKQTYYGAGAGIAILIAMLGLTTITMIRRAGSADAARSAAIGAAQRVERQFLDAIEELPVMMAMFDSSRRLQHFNRAFATAGGVGESEVGRDMLFEDVLRTRVARGFMPEGSRDDPEAWINQRLSVFGRGPNLSEFDFGERGIEIRDVPLPGGGVLVLISDITDRRKTEREILRLNAELEKRVEERTGELRAAQAGLVRSERLATLGQLAATVSHELRNPLGAISTSVAVVEAKIDARELGLERAMDRIRRGIGRCDRIVSEMLDFARERDLMLVETDIDSWLAELLDEQDLPETIRLRLDGQAGSATIDPELFRRAIINLVENARDALLADENPQRPREIVVETRRAGGRIAISVIDTGPGMPGEVQENSTEPLFSTKAFGVGLGLPVVKKIAEQHNGALHIESAPGRGTCITLTIPRTQPGRQAAE